MSKEKGIEAAGWRVRTWAAAVDMCEASVYNLLAARKIRAKKLGGATVIITSPDAFLSSLPDYQPNARPSPNSTGNNGRRLPDDPVAAAWTAPADNQPEAVRRAAE